MNDELRMLKSSIDISVFTAERIKEVKLENQKLKLENQKLKQQLKDRASKLQYENLDEYARSKCIELEVCQQQLESLKHDYREKLGYLSSNKWTYKTALSVEMERMEKEELRDRLEYEVKMIEGAAKDEINRLKQQLESCQGQLKEAVEVIHWYAMPSINHHAYHDIMGTNLNIKAEQFLAKYRREK